MTELLAQPTGPALVEPKTVSGSGAAPDAELGAIGKENEDIRGHYLELVRRFDELADVRNSFIKLFSRVEAILEDRERTKAALVERSMNLALAERAHQELKAEHRALYEGSNELRAESSLLRSENERLKASVRDSETRIKTVETELRRETDAAASVRAELEREHGRVSQLGGELQTVQAELRENDAVVSQLQVELATTRDEKTFGENRLKMLQATLAESQQNEARLQRALADSQNHANGLSDKIREIEITVDSGRRQIKDLETLLSLTQKDHLEAQSQWQREMERARLSLAASENQIAELASHSKAGEGLLADVRSQLQARSDEFRAEGRRAEDLENKLARAHESQQNDAEEIAQLKQLLKDREAMHARLTDRIEAVVRGTRDLTARLEQAEQRALLAGEQLASETKRFEEHSERCEQTIRELTEQLDKEKLAKTLLEGALEAARQRPSRD